MGPDGLNWPPGPSQQLARSKQTVRQLHHAMNLLFLVRPDQLT